MTVIELQTAIQTTRIGGPTAGIKEYVKSLPRIPRIPYEDLNLIFQAAVNGRRGEHV